MKLTEMLEAAGCASDKVAYFNGQGFSNTWGILPIPNKFAKDFAKMVRDEEEESDVNDPYNPGKIRYMAVSELSQTSRYSILRTLKNHQDSTPQPDGCPTPLYFQWCELTQYLYCEATEDDG